MIEENNISPIRSDFEQIKKQLNRMVEVIKVMKAVQSIGLLVICALH